MLTETIPKFAIAWVSNVNNNLQFYGFTRHTRILIFNLLKQKLNSKGKTNYDKQRNS